jgi:hypothetical protein
VLQFLSQQEDELGCPSNLKANFWSVGTEAACINVLVPLLLYHLKNHTPQIHPTPRKILQTLYTKRRSSKLEKKNFLCIYFSHRKSLYPHAEQPDSECIQATLCYNTYKNKLKNE